MRDAVGVNRDQADRALALERAEPLHDRAQRQSEPALAGDLDGNEIAVGRAGGRVGCNGDFAAELLLVDRHQAAAAAGDAAENAKRAVLGAVDQLDDASARLVIARPGCWMRSSARSPTPAVSPGGPGAALRCG